MVTIIDASETTIVKDYGDGVVACQHANGYVGIYSQDGDDLMQISALTRGGDKSATDIADAIFYTGHAAQ